MGFQGSIKVRVHNKDSHVSQAKKNAAFSIEVVVSVQLDFLVQVLLLIDTFLRCLRHRLHHVRSIHATQSFRWSNSSDRDSQMTPVHDPYVLLLNIPWRLSEELCHW